MTRPHPLNAGLPETLRAGGSTEFFVQSVTPRDLRLETVATYTLRGREYPAIQAGEIGDAQVALLYFDAGDEPERRLIKRLLVNAVYWAAS